MDKFEVEYFDKSSTSRGANVVEKFHSFSAYRQKKRKFISFHLVISIFQVQNCDPIHDLDYYVPQYHDMRDIVFVAQMPHQRDGISLEYSAWFQFLLGLLEVDIEYDPKFTLGNNFASFF